jgi:hypothetical protein
MLNAEMDLKLSDGTVLDVGSELGKGGQGTVYEVNNDLYRDVCIKILGRGNIR